MNVQIYGRGACTLLRRLGHPSVESKQKIEIIYPDQDLPHLVWVTLGETALETQRQRLDPRPNTEPATTLFSLRVYSRVCATVEHALLDRHTFFSVQPHCNIVVDSVSPSSRILESMTCRVPVSGTISLGGLTVNGLTATTYNGIIHDAKVIQKATLETTGENGLIRVHALSSCVKECSGDALVEDMKDSTSDEKDTASLLRSVLDSIINSLEEPVLERKTNFSLLDQVIGRHGRSRSRSPAFPRGGSSPRRRSRSPVLPRSRPTTHVILQLPGFPPRPSLTEAETFLQLFGGNVLEPRESREAGPPIKILNPSGVAMTDEPTELKKDQCYVCFENTRRLMNVACSHLQVCFACVKQLVKPGTKCITCRKPVTAWQVVC